LMRYDLAVVGSGQGGVPLALAFATRGKRVVLFERGDDFCIVLPAGAAARFDGESLEAALSRDIERGGPWPVGDDNRDLRVQPALRDAIGYGSKVRAAAGEQDPEPGRRRLLGWSRGGPRIGCGGAHA